MTRPRVSIVGAGFAGFHCARARMRTAADWLVHATLGDDREGWPA